MYYKLYEMSHAALAPWRAAADVTRLFFSNPVNPASHTHFGKQMAASAELFERTTRRYGKPEFDIAKTAYKGMPVAVEQETVWQRPFCNLLHFSRNLPANAETQPRLLIVAPMSGHYATLLRGTVQTMSQYADVYITDWIDARMVPLADGNLRSRRLHRLHHRDAAFPRRKHACHGRLPAVGAGIRGRGGHGRPQAIRTRPPR